MLHVTAEDGKEYYVDPNTGESTWTRPVDFSWVQAQSEDHGREYYHNTVTQVHYHATLKMLVHFVNGLADTAANTCCRNRYGKSQNHCSGRKFP